MHILSTAFLSSQLRENPGFLRLGKAPFLGVVQEVSGSLQVEGSSMQEWAAVCSMERRSPALGGAPLYPRSQGSWVVVQADSTGARCPNPSGGEGTARASDQVPPARASRAAL